MDYQVDLSKEFRPYDNTPASVEYAEIRKKNVIEKLQLAQKIGRAIWQRHDSGGTVPYDGTMTVYMPSGTMLRCLVDWRGKHALERHCEEAVSVREAREIATR
jgi:hypothetical protein